LQAAPRFDGQAVSRFLHPAPRLWVVSGAAAGPIEARARSDAGRAAQALAARARELGLVGDRPATPEGARAFRSGLEELGTAFVKLGQLLSSRPDLVPDVYTDELSKLTDEVPPVPFTEIEKTIERDLGDDVFASIEAEPLPARLRSARPPRRGHAVRVRATPARDCSEPRRRCGRSHAPALRDEPRDRRVRLRARAPSQASALPLAASVANPCGRGARGSPAPGSAVPDQAAAELCPRREDALPGGPDRAHARSRARPGRITRPGTRSA
jgi:hypothetical protein